MSRPMVWPDGSLIEVGQKVHTRDAVRPGRYAGRVGEVVQVVDTLSEYDRLVYVGEVRVIGAAFDAWFRPSELYKVPHTAYKARRSPEILEVGIAPAIPNVG